MVTIRDIRDATSQLGLSGSPVCVHASLRSFGWVAGGASAVVEGLLAEGCTIMVPTFSWTFAVPPSGRRLLRNGCSCDTYPGSTLGIGRVYTPDTMEIDKGDMGRIPSALVAMPQRVRGNHPLSSFAAVGPLADELTSGQEPLHVWAPLEALAKEHGSVVLMGVALCCVTLLHLAEQTAGRNPFRRWANGPDGQPMEVEVGGCSGGFVNLDPVLSPIVRERKVGESLWRAFSAKAALKIATQAIRQKPWLTHCKDSRCERCNDAVLGGPVLTDNRRGR